jgi:hypothetical protein
MKRLRYRIAYLLRLLAYRIEPPPSLIPGETLASMITAIEPLDTPVLTDPDFKLCDWREDDPPLKRPWREGDGPPLNRNLVLHCEVCGQPVHPSLGGQILIHNCPGQPA